ncbi:hypothetical protein [Saccharothrix luteola]|uniref:hypothetical protein n=1 Tax=Saccharothrix luteola TaxID=2893018 RepID=UPI001E543F77|nr:hypothetical protein [Saccharothrix luteola]MCC8244180.1 hypothetical protein [Saccharothrix luteola]MCC8250902.1 hypothetical protein [Saccharothrix luteola]
MVAVVAGPVSLAWPQRAAVVLGVLLVAWGVADLVRSEPGWAVLHLVSGVVIGAAAVRTRVARLVGSMTGVVYLVVFAFGVSESGGSMDAGLIGNAVHLLIGFASVGVAEGCAWCEQRARRAADSH